MPASNGGTTVPLDLALFPLTIGGAGFIYTFDVTNFNDSVSGGFYNWKLEDVIAGRTPTVNRVIISVRDLGVATITVTLSGIDQNTQQPISNSVPLTIGTVGASNKLITYLPGISLTAQNLQLSITRAANVGPVSITKVRMEGRVETTPYG
jgi:hypothetical protein